MAAWPPRGFTPKEFRTPRPELERPKLRFGTFSPSLQHADSDQPSLPSFARLRRTGGSFRLRTASNFAKASLDKSPRQVGGRDRHSVFPGNTRAPTVGHSDFDFLLAALSRRRSGSELGFRPSDFSRVLCTAIRQNRHQPRGFFRQRPLDFVAQVSKPAVSPTSKSAGRTGSRAASGFGNPRHSRLGSLRYFGCGCAALCSLRLNLPPLSVPPGNPPIRRSALHPQTLRRHFRAP